MLPTQYLLFILRNILKNIPKVSLPGCAACLSLSSALSFHQRCPTRCTLTPQPFSSIPLFPPMPGTVESNARVRTCGGGGDSRNLLRSRFCEHHKACMSFRPRPSYPGNFYQPQRIVLRVTPPGLCRREHGGWARYRIVVVGAQRDLARGSRSADRF